MLNLVFGGLLAWALKTDAAKHAANPPPSAPVRETTLLSPLPQRLPSNLPVQMIDLYEPYDLDDPDGPGTDLIQPPEAPE